MKKISEKFKKETEKVVSLTDLQDEVTTSRRVFPADYKLLREMAFKEEKTITQVLNDVYTFIKPKLEVEGISFLPEVNDSSKSNTHKAVRLPLEFNEFLNEISKNNKEISSKKLLSSCLNFYINNRK